MMVVNPINIDHRDITIKVGIAMVTGHSRDREISVYPEINPLEIEGATTTMITDDKRVSVNCLNCVRRALYCILNLKDITNNIFILQFIYHPFWP